MLFFYAVFSSKTAQSNVLNIYRLCGICLFSPCQWPLLLDFFLSKYFRPLVALNLLLQPVLAFKTDKMLGGRGTSWRWPGLKQQWQRFWFKNQSPSPLQELWTAFSSAAFTDGFKHDALHTSRAHNFKVTESPHEAWSAHRPGMCPSDIKSQKQT